VFWAFRTRRAPRCCDVRSVTHPHIECLRFTALRSCCSPSRHSLKIVYDLRVLCEGCGGIPLQSDSAAKPPALMGRESPVFSRYSRQQGKAGSISKCSSVLSWKRRAIEWYSVVVENSTSVRVLPSPEEIHHRGRAGGLRGSSAGFWVHRQTLYAKGEQRLRIECAVLASKEGGLTWMSAMVRWSTADWLGLRWCFSTGAAVGFSCELDSPAVFTSFFGRACF